MQKPIKILIIGNGFGGTYTLKNLHKYFHKNKNVEMSLVGDKNYFLFTPLLHEVATGSINPRNIIEPIRNVLSCCLKNFYLGKAQLIDTKAHTVKVGDTLIPYDYLVLAPGAETNFYNTPGAEANSFTLKSIDDAIAIKNHCIMQMEKGAHITDPEERRKVLRFVIIGGGPTGVELAAELQEFIKGSFSRYYTKEVIADASVVLIEKGTELVSMFGKKVRTKSLQVLKKKGVEVMLNTGVKEITDSSVIFENGKSISTETTFWVAGVKPSGLNFDTPVKQAPNGKLVVNQYLELAEHPEIFAIGDAAGFVQKNGNGVDTPVPALAQVAEKESITVARNIYLLTKGKAPQAFSYHHAGDFISLGKWMAIGEISNFTFWGHIAWWVWRTVYLWKLISWRKKFEVALDWTTNLFSERDISKI